MSAFVCHVCGIDQSNLFLWLVASARAKPTLFAPHCTLRTAVHTHWAASPAVQWCRRYVADFTDVTTAQELKAQGWNGVIDALVYPRDSYVLEAVLPYLTM
jgi:hypothetical protein